MRSDSVVTMSQPMSRLLSDLIRSAVTRAARRLALPCTLMLALGACGQDSVSPASAAPDPAASAAAAGQQAAIAAQPPLIAPDPFPNVDTVTVDALLRALAVEADALALAPQVRSDFDVLVKRHGLLPRDGLYADYVRVRLAFEATRAGGWWGLRWAVTDQQPQSDAVWAQWRGFVAPTGAASTPAAWRTTAVAECDELSALFAVVARGIGLSPRSHVGLMWPTSNHAVAVWMPHGANGMRVIVPTSQVYLDTAQSLGTTDFDAWAQPRVYDYGRRDIAPDARLPAPLARYFVDQVRRHGAESQGQAQARRNRREYDQRMQDQGL